MNKVHDEPLQEFQIELSKLIHKHNVIAGAFFGFVRIDGKLRCAQFHVENQEVQPSVVALAMTRGLFDHGRAFVRAAGSRTVFESIRYVKGEPPTDEMPF